MMASNMGEREMETYMSRVFSSQQSGVFTGTILLSWEAGKYGTDITEEWETTLTLLLPTESRPVAYHLPGSRLDLMEKGA
jgi:hypothetical protein